MNHDIVRILRSLALKTLSGVFLFFILISPNTFANSNAHGVLMVVKGDVQVIQKDKTVKAKVGTKVVQGDTISTGKDSRAKLVMVDKNVINISPNSKFLLEKYEYNPDTNKKGALLNVIYGKVRTTVNQKYDGDTNKFQVKTKSSVAGVRGTDFLVSFNEVTSTSKVVTFEGVVEVGSGLDKMGKITNPVSVTPGQFTVAAMGTAPATPVVMPEAEMNSLNSQTVAEAPPAKSDQPAQPNGEKKERTPSNQPPQDSGAAAPGSVLNQMGEDVSAPAVTGNNQMPPPPIVPAIGIGTNQPCPNGQCGVPTTVDPTLIQGKTNLLINLQPNP